MLEQFLSNILYTAFHILSVLTLVVIFKLLKEINSLVISFIAFSMLHPNLTLLKQSMSSTTIKLESLEVGLRCQHFSTLLSNSKVQLNLRNIDLCLEHQNAHIYYWKEGHLY